MHPVMELLAAGVPISLLCDLAEPHGPDSELISRAEQRSVPRDTAAAALPA